MDYESILIKMNKSIKQKFNEAWLQPLARFLLIINGKKSQVAVA
jgi:hypothetical protein